MKFVKKHLFAIISIAIIFIMLIVGALFAYTLFYDTSLDPYETRLNGIEKVKITNVTKTAIQEQILETGKVETVTYDLRGRLVYYLIDIKNGTEIKSAKELATIIKENFSEEQLKFYDIQVFLTDKVEQKSAEEKKAALEEGSEEVIKTVYPVIGYKHKSSETFVWTK